MKDFNHIKYVYFLGIGGIGMSALARYFKVKGMVVSGYDKTPTALTSELSGEGISVHFEDDVTGLPAYFSNHDNDAEILVIYTPAIPSDHKELNYLKNKGYKLWKRSEVLGQITKGTTTIAVAGTHGKTTTSTMIAHVLKHHGVNCTAFLGGISANYNTNLLLPDITLGKEVMVVEADEYDRSFHTLFPDFAVITSLDADHLDIYGNHQAMIDAYRKFAGQVETNGMLIFKSGLPLGDIREDARTYSIVKDADYRAQNISVSEGAYHFSIQTPRGNYDNFILSWPGRHNVENAVATFAICTAYGLDADQVRAGLATFKGVKRRFDYQIKSDKIVMIDDYAHHPGELEAAIGSVKELYPGKKILGIFQPHLYSRTKDFADEFGKSLSGLDELVLLDIYPARELPVEGVTSGLILEHVELKSKKVCSVQEMFDEVSNSNAGVILTLGAGDIDKLVEPVKKILMQKFNIQKP